MLKEIYPQIKSSIVAIALTRKADGEFFQIVGTGFVVREDGIILTNHHVIQAINDLPQVKEEGANPIQEACVLFFHRDEKSTQLIALEIEEFYLPELKIPEGAAYYGGDSVDLGIIELKSVRGLPVMKIYDGPYIEGEAVSTSGFPMGTEVLQLNGWIDQLGPSLRSGIISAVLPMICKTPHALLLDLMTQGGASGSPVFLSETGEVIGIIDSGIPGTNFSYCIPSWFIDQALRAADRRPEIAERAKGKTHIEEWIKSKQVWNQKPKTGLTQNVGNSTTQ